MADQLLAEPPPAVDLNPDAFSSEFDSLPIPPMDPNFFADLDGDLDFSFSFDDLYLPSDDILGTSVSAQGHTDHHSPDSSGVSTHPGGSEVSGNYFTDMFLNYSSTGFSQNSGDRGSESARADNCSSPESGGAMSSQGSGNCGSAVSEGVNLAADSGNCERDVSSHMVIDQKLKVEKMEKMGKISLSKRKKDQGDTNSETRTTKYRRSLKENENVAEKSSFDGVSEDEEKRKARLIRNRESAQLSRQRKKHYVEELEDKVRAMHSTIADLNSKISYIMAENVNLRNQLGSSGMCPPPPPGMYPHPAMVPMTYPWMPCAPYVVKPQGSQVPLVPIPRLKTQQPIPASKAKKSENKKSEGKAKKVASISFLGLLFFILLFGGLAPIVNVKYAGMKDEIPGGLSYVGGSFYDLHRGKLLTVNGHSNGSDHSQDRGFSNVKFDVASRINCETSDVGLSNSDLQRKDRGSRPHSTSDEFVTTGNSSESLVASLYVPRNDKLVKIDGNLIIQSVLVSEKAMASRVVSEMKTKDTSLAIPRNLVPALPIPDVGRNGRTHPHSVRNPTDKQKALSSGSSDYKSSTADGVLQQWFHEGLAGPLLSSGKCSEVFRFDVLPSSSASGAIVPASTVANISAQNRENVTYMGKNRRILHSLPIPVARSKLNASEESQERNIKNDGLPGNKSVSSSMVVSVLIDPREVGDGDSDGMIAPKSLSRIFVVVLVDSVKYVTYSCMLPRSGPHLDGRWLSGVL